MTLHIAEELSSIEMICGIEKWRLKKNDGYLTVSSFEALDFKSTVCDKCAEDPRVQLLLLACTELH